MSLLNKPARKERKSKHFFGGYLPGWIGTYVSLYCIATGTSKNALLTRILTGWMDHHGTRSKDELAKDIITNLQLRWAYECRKPEIMRLPFGTFKRNVEMELKDKGIESVYIETIITALKDE